MCKSGSFWHVVARAVGTLAAASVNAGAAPWQRCTSIISFNPDVGFGGRCDYHLCFLHEGSSAGCVRAHSLNPNLRLAGPEATPRGCSEKKESVQADNMRDPVGFLEPPALLPRASPSTAGNPNPTYRRVLFLIPSFLSDRFEQRFSSL